jgi:hypothetical protein
VPTLGHVTVHTQDKANTHTAAAVCLAFKIKQSMKVCEAKCDWNSAAEDIPMNPDCASTGEP